MREPECPKPLYWEIYALGNPEKPLYWEIYALGNPEPVGLIDRDGAWIDLHVPDRLPDHHD